MYVYLCMYDVSMYMSYICEYMYMCIFKNYIVIVSSSTSTCISISISISILIVVVAIVVVSKE